MQLEFYLFHLSILVVLTRIPACLLISSLPKEALLVVFKGILSSLPATDIGAQNVRACLQDASALQEEIDECIVGQVLTGGVGQAPAKANSFKSRFVFPCSLHDCE